MTRNEFTAQFDRLCRGFKYDPTPEQAEAWYRKIGHVSVSVWAESVTTLLCAKYFPKFEEALHALDQEAETQRKVAVQRERHHQASGVLAGIDRDLEQWRARLHTPRPSCPICQGDVHTGSPCWPWLDGAERERRHKLEPYRTRLAHLARPAIEVQAVDITTPESEA